MDKGPYCDVGGGGGSGDREESGRGSLHSEPGKQRRKCHQFRADKPAKKKKKIHSDWRGGKASDWLGGGGGWKYPMSLVQGEGQWFLSSDC